MIMGNESVQGGKASAMESFIHPAVKNIAVSGIRQMANRMSRYDRVLSLTLGQPDFPTPAHVLEAAKRALDEGKTVYTANAGLPELRQAASRFVESRYGLSYRPEDEVIVTCGASEALDIVFRTILQPGDEVVLPGPVYPGYEPIVRMCGAVPVFADTRATGFKLTADAVAARLTDRTRAVVLASPSNPTGRVLTGRELEDIAALLAGRPVFIISDEIYSELVYDGRRHHSIASVGGARGQTIVINGLSKSHAMTGFRIGFVFAPADIARHLVKVHQYSVACASSISQYAALEALVNGPDDAVPMRGEYERRRDFVYRRLTEIGFPVEKPEGAFYMFPSVAPFHADSTEFALRLLDEERVAVVPGTAFAPFGDESIRISYAASMEVLEEALERLERFVRRLDRRIG